MAEREVKIRREIAQLLDKVRAEVRMEQGIAHAIKSYPDDYQKSHARRLEGFKDLEKKLRAARASAYAIKRAA